MQCICLNHLFQHRHCFKCTLCLISHLDNRPENKYMKGLFDNILTKVLKAYLFQDTAVPATKSPKVVRHHKLALKIKYLHIYTVHLTGIF